MKFKLSILNVLTVVFMVVCIAFGIFNYEELNEGEGWGIVGMIGLLGFGIILLLVDIVIQNVFKNRTTANIIGLAVGVVAALLLLSG